ncbi:DJ-1/PfpI/YhbO family deglycase/protease [Candidatus Pelagibacter sp.]|jgi:protease I|nr:DJ-1/PfpI/YhbO family deglycase/protease [Candidatus Pelagibacter sp.]
MKALIITSQLVQDHEFIYPFYRLKEEGIHVDVYNQSNQIVKGFFGTKIPPQKDDNIVTLDNIDLDSYELLVLPGGVKSMELLRLDNGAINLVREFNKKCKLIAAICSGTMMLISADIIKNKKVTGYYAWKQDIINAGAEFVDNPSVEDDNIITSPHYKYNGEWMKLVISKLKK